MEIAAQFGVSYRTIYRWVDPAGAERQRENSRAYKKRNRARIRERDRFYNLHRRGRAEMPYDRFLRELDGASVA